MLYIIPTPIGNLEDITLRALRILKEVDLIAAEDTRHSRILLNHYEIKTPVESFHSYSDERTVTRFISRLKEGQSIALISDAGMPGISDPGFRLITAALDEDVPLTVLPGATAAVTALVASGFPMDKFLYIGFLPLKRKRKSIIADLAHEPRTVILYEAPHRLLKTLGELRAAAGNECRIAVCRELTKKFEEIFRGTLQEAYEHFSKKRPRGEFTLVLAGRSHDEHDAEEAS